MEAPSNFTESSTFVKPGHRTDLAESLPHAPSSPTSSTSKLSLQKPSTNWSADTPEPYGRISHKKYCDALSLSNHEMHEMKVHCKSVCKRHSVTTSFRQLRSHRPNTLERVKAEVSLQNNASDCVHSSSPMLSRASTSCLGLPPIYSSLFSWGETQEKMTTGRMGYRVCRQGIMVMTAWKWMMGKRIRLKRITQSPK